MRQHPVTGEKALYVNPGFTRRIVGLPKAESDAVLRLLFAQLSENPDFQVRFRWTPNALAIWDNRVRSPPPLSPPFFPFTHTNTD